MFTNLRSASLSALLLGSLAGACASPAAHLPPASTASAAPLGTCAGGTVHNAHEANQYARCTLVVGDLHIQGSNLTQLDALANLRSVSGSLEIADNPKLSELTGLERLTSVGSLEIADNRALDGLEALRHLSSTRALTIRDNAELDSLRGLEGLASVQSLNIERNGIFSTAGLENLRTVGDLVVSHNSKLISLAGLKSLTYASSIEIRNNRLLAGYFGLLPQLQQVDEQLVLRSNEGLAEHEVSEVRDRVRRNNQQKIAERTQQRELSLR